MNNYVSRYVFKVIIFILTSEIKIMFSAILCLIKMCLYNGISVVHPPPICRRVSACRQQHADPASDELAAAQPTVRAALAVQESAAWFPGPAVPSI